MLLQSELFDAQAAFPNPLASQLQEMAMAQPYKSSSRNLNSGRRSVDFRLKEKQILDSVLGPRVYDRRIRPAGVNSSGNLVR